MLREQSKPTPEPPCSFCGKPSVRESWGAKFCTSCAEGWSGSPEYAAARLKLDPLPAWQLARLQPHERPPEPTDDMRRAEYRSALRAWSAKRKLEAA